MGNVGDRTESAGESVEIRKLRLMRLPLQAWRGIFCVVMRRLEGKRDPVLFRVMLEDAAVLDRFWRSRGSDQEGQERLAEALRRMEGREFSRGKTKVIRPFSPEFVRGLVGFFISELETRQRADWPDYIRTVYDVVCRPDSRDVGAARERERPLLIGKVKGARKARRVALLIAAEMCRLWGPRSADRLARMAGRGDVQGSPGWLAEVDTRGMTSKQYQVFLRLQRTGSRPR
jgi:hypothetical protein